MRHNRNQLLHTIMMGKVEREKTPGTRKMAWSCNIKDWTGVKTAKELFRMAMDRERWKELTGNLMQLMERYSKITEMRCRIPKYTLLLILQIIFFIAFNIVFISPPELTKPLKIAPEMRQPKEDEGGEAMIYEGFESVHAMVFIGFGFLLTFFKKYSYTGVGFNWFLGAFVIQYALLCYAGRLVLTMKTETMLVNKHTLIEADMLAATALISFGAVLGLTSGPQLLVLAIFEIPLAAANMWLFFDHFMAIDTGRSMCVHLFAALFGLGASLSLRVERTEGYVYGRSYTSDITAMIGTLFLYVYWPSYNAALVRNICLKNWVAVNTYFALAASTVTSFVFSSVLNKGRFLMQHVQNCPLAGAVAVGSVSNLFISPAGATAIGMGSGALSVLGYRYITPCLERRCGIKDTCGIINVHGMPGFLSGLLTIPFLYYSDEDATREVIRMEMREILPPFDPANPIIKRSGQLQCLYQAFGLAATVGIALFGGIITGCIAKLKIFKPLVFEQQFNDETNWEMPTSAHCFVV